MPRKPAENKTKPNVALIAGVLSSFVVATMQGANAAQSPNPVAWKACMSQKPAWYAGAEAIRIADNVLLYQRDAGGWPKNTDMAAMLTAEQRMQLQRDRHKNDATIDNGATCRPLQFLARVHRATGEVRLADACRRGLDYLLAAQYDTGGWPQFYPDPSGYHAYITFNDNAMINVMRLLDQVARGDGDFAFVDAPRRARAAAAVARGIECILKCQIIVDGRRLGWCAQHDPVSFEPRPARTYEKASLSGSEGAGIVAYLMEIEPPSPRVIEAVEAAVRWFDEVKITGLRVARQPAPDTPRGYDTIVVADPEAPPIWARFYEIGTNRPIFCSRDGIVRYRLSEISYERRNGYSWYTGGPADLLNKQYPRWRTRWTPDRNVLSR